MSKFTKSSSSKKSSTKIFSSSKPPGLKKKSSLNRLQSSKRVRLKSSKRKSQSTEIELGTPTPYWNSSESKETEKVPGKVKVLASADVFIRQRPVYPGECNGLKVDMNTTIPFVTKTLFAYCTHYITFYELQDGRGWIHNYNPMGFGVCDGLKEIDKTGGDNDEGFLIDLEEDQTLDNIETLELEDRTEHRPLSNIVVRVMLPYELGAGFLTIKCGKDATGFSLKCKAIKKVNSKQGKNADAAAFMLGFVNITNTNFKTAVLVRKNIFRRTSVKRYPCGCWVSTNQELVISERPTNTSPVNILSLNYPIIVTGYQRGNWIHHDQGWSKISNAKSILLEPLDVEWFISPAISGGKNEKEVKVVFEPGIIGFAFCRTKVIDVGPGSQAERKGVRIGWRVIGINDIILPKDDHSIEKILGESRDKGKKVQFTFSVPEPDSTSEEKTSSVLHNNPKKGNRNATRLDNESKD